MRKILSNIRSVFWLNRAQWRHGKVFALLLLLFWLVLEPVAELINVYLPNIIISALTENKPFYYISTIIVVFQLLLMAKPMYEDIFNMFCKDRMLPKIELELKRSIYESAIQADFQYIDDPEYYDRYSWAVDDYAGKAAEAQRLINRSAYSLLTSLSMLVIIASISPLAIIITVVASVIENAMYSVTNRHDVQKDADIVPWDRRLGYFHRIFYMKEYAADLKSTSLKKYIFRLYDIAQKNKLNIIKNAGKKMIGWSLTADLAHHAAKIFITLNIVYGIYRQDFIDVGAYVTAMLAVQKFTEMTNDIFYHVKEWNKLGLYATRIRSFFQVKSVIEGQNGKDIPLPDRSFSVEFRDVSFQYENSAFAISHVSLNIKPGEKLAIVGENGAGKSTLVKLLLRLYDTTSGSIIIDGKDIRDYDLAGLRRKVGVAFQHPNVYAISLKENIELYHEASDEKLLSIIDHLQLHRALVKNNASLQTELTKEFNDDGIVLSGGEVQKISIARLLTGNFGLLILDEPSSALDPIAEYEMSKLILDSSNRSTTIIISHRLSTIRNADRIVLMEGGQIKEIGTHNELLLANGRYSEMFTKQAENYLK